MNESASHLERLATRAIALYSRPTVAMEVVRLAEQPRVDPTQLRRSIEQDPALACKVLRVVNSSLFGLQRPVADLNQAIGLLGIKPLKLLVLGFSLPDSLFAEVAASELRWYWTRTLTRAVAARMLCEQLWHKAGDEAFIAGLLQDIGILVLMRELGEPYARFLAGAVHEKCHLAALEQDTLGFDHTQLSAALLARWQLPERLVDAIAAPKKQARLARMTPPEGDLPQILHLAEMLVQLVGQRQLDVLGDLLEAGKAYRGMTKANLAALVEVLQPQVDQLAEVLSLELAEDRNYVQVLLEAHQQMATLSEALAAPAAAESADDRLHAQLLAQTRELSEAMQEFLTRGQKASAGPQSDRNWISQHAPHESAEMPPASNTAHMGPSVSATGLLRKVTAAVNRCRERRKAISLLLAEPNVYDVHSDPGAVHAGRLVRSALLRTCESMDRSSVSVISLDDERTAVILTNCERQAAVAMAHNVADALGSPEAARGSSREPDTTLSIGVATASVVPKNFDPLRLIESAERCLSAARACGISAVKSIEV
jgi:HD-like signal output (HDOD) protein/GGDEF domain-containing protein